MSPRTASWLIAAQLYARYMLKRFGDNTLIKMLMAYRRGLTTNRATPMLQRGEAGLREGLFVLSRRGGQDDPNSGQPKKADQILPARAASEGDPDDPDLNARMAYEHFPVATTRRRGRSPTRRVQLKPHHPLASYVKARLLITIGDEDAALAIIEPALDPKHPNERVIDLLAKLKMKAGHLDEAETLYELARKDDTFHTKWIAGLARVHLRQKNTVKFS